MQKINTLDFDTHRGLRYVELFQGDMLELDSKIDVLVVSAFQDSYEPIRKTLIASLADKGVVLADLMKKPEIDLRQSLNTALTSRIQYQQFDRILVFEMKTAAYYKSGQLDLHEIFENLFISLLLFEKKGFEIGSVAMPLIGTGSQKININDIAKMLPEMTKKFLSELSHLQRILFIDRNQDKIQLLSNELNNVLGRPEIVIVKDSFVEHLRMSIETKIPLLKMQLKAKDNTLDELKITLCNPEALAYETSIAGRKLLEYLLHYIVDKPMGTLVDRIEVLNHKNIAPWMISSMHLIRVFGNYSVHFQNKKKIPIEKTSDDFLLNLNCIERIIDFGIEYFKNHPSK